jgi:hypothetical protein
MMKNAEEDSRENDHRFTSYSFKQNDAVSASK